jgi:hypothetical protein
MKISQEFREAVRREIVQKGPVPVLKKFKCAGKVLGKLKDKKGKVDNSQEDPIFQLSRATGHATKLIEAATAKIIAIAKKKGTGFVMRTLQEI